MAKNKQDTVREMGGDNRKRDPFEGLSSQIKAEYNLAWKHQKSKKDESEVRLKLLNNQKRDKTAVGDTTMFSVFQTVLASLYDDRLEVNFEGREEGDEGVAENLNILAENDYSDMQKDMVDFYWDWDTLFFGRGLINLEEYVRDPDKNIFIPVPQILDPITFMRDPFATSVNGDIFGRGSCRFYGYETKMTKSELMENSNIFDEVKNDNFKGIDYGSGSYSLLEDAIDARNDAQNNQTQVRNESEKELGANSQYTVTIWNTHYENPKTGKVTKQKVWLSNDRTKVIGIKEVKTDYWPVIDRPLYPHSHDWDGTSIPDLVEDKQRARAIAQNLALNAMKSDLYPRYIYDSNKITNRNDLNIKFNKHIPVDAKDQPVGNALTPVLNPRPNMGLLDFIYNSLDLSAQKATATPDIQQGIQSEKDRPLGETNLIASRVDTRYSLSAKVFGWSEKEFWRQWYGLYKENFAEDIDEKMLRVVGAFGPKWRPLKKEDITTDRYEPDIKIESRNVSRAKRIEERQLFTQFLSLALQDPTSNRRYGLRKLAKLNGLKLDEIDRLFPLTIDERIAEEENDSLNEDKLVTIRSEDDHNVHLEVHAKANLTKATIVHIKAHERALSIKKIRPDLFPADQSAASFEQGQEGVLPNPASQMNQPPAPVAQAPIK